MKVFSLKLLADTFKLFIRVWLTIFILAWSVEAVALADVKVKSDKKPVPEKPSPKRKDKKGQKSNSEYHAVIAEAVQEFKDGNWYEAMVLFRKAHKLSPSARTLRGMGLAAFENRRYVESIQWLSGSLEHPNRPLTPAMKAGIPAILKRAMGYVGTYTLELDPADATLEIDGRKAFIKDGKLILNPGERRLVVSADGYDTFKRRLNVQIGGNGVLTIHLKSSPIKETPVAATPDLNGARGDDEKAVDGNQDMFGEALIPWIVIGAGSALAVTGGVLIGMALSEKSYLEDPQEPMTLSEFNSKNDWVWNVSIVGGSLIGAGVIGAGVGVILLSQVDETYGSPKTEPKMKMQISTSGLYVMGSF